MSPEALASLRAAGRIAAAARAMGERRVVPGARVRDVCDAVEAEIRRLGGRAAFPVQSSRNEVAAHYCPSPEDETTYAAGDLAKLDIGVHVDGWVVDTASTVNVGDWPENRRAVEAARAALDAALKLAGPGVPVRRLSEAIEAQARAFGLQPVRNICGHGVGRWSVHIPPPIPNVPEDEGDLLLVGATVAIEPFVTDGGGLVAEVGLAEVFRLPPERAPGALDGADPGVLDAILAFRGLPFSRRQLGGLRSQLVERVLYLLAAAGALQAYAPLVETSGRPVAQAEHTIAVTESGIEVLTA